MKRYLLLLLLAICFLFGCSSVREEEEDVIGSNDGYFFPQGTTSEIYSGRIWQLSSQENEIKLSITEVKSFEEGNLYELRLNCEEEVQDRYGINRLYLGLFLVLEDKIYFVRDEGIKDELESTNEIMDRGTLICNREGKEDTLEEGERGWHEYILADGNRREYHGYNNFVETGYYECFVWEMGKGLVEYRSGYGAEAEAIALYLN